MISDLQRSCEDRTESFHIPHIQFPLLLTLMWYTYHNV